MDEIFGGANRVSIVTLKKTAGQDERLINNVADYVLWYSKDKAQVKFRPQLSIRSPNYQELGQYSRIQCGRRKSPGSDKDGLHSNRGP